MFKFLFPALLASASLTTGLAVSQNSPRADGSNYLIIPNDRFNTDDYESKLYKTVSEKSVYKSENCQLGVLFWSTKLSSSQANSLKDDSVRTWPVSHFTEYKPANTHQFFLGRAHQYR